MNSLGLLVLLGLFSVDLVRAMWFIEKLSANLYTPLEKLLRSIDRKATDFTVNRSSSKQRGVIRKQIYTVFNFRGGNVGKLLIIPKTECLGKRGEPQNRSYSSIATSGNDIFGLKNETGRNDELTYWRKNSNITSFLPSFIPSRAIITIKYLALHDNVLYFTE